MAHPNYKRNSGSPAQRHPPTTMTSRQKNDAGGSSFAAAKDQGVPAVAVAEPTTRICIKNVPPSITQVEQVKKFLFTSQEAYFAPPKFPALTITDCRILPKRRMAFCGFSTKECAATCVQYLHGTYWKTTKIVVEFAFPPKENSNHINYISNKNQKQSTNALKENNDTKKIKEYETDPKKKETNNNAVVEKKKKEFLDHLGGKGTSAGGSSSSRGAAAAAFWSNDDVVMPQPEQQQEVDEPLTKEPAAPSLDDNEDSDSDGDDSKNYHDDDDDESSQDDAEPLLESHKGMSDLDFLRAKTVTVEELLPDEEVEGGGQATNKNKDNDENDDLSSSNEEEDDDEVVEMKGVDASINTTNSNIQQELSSSHERDEKLSGDIATATAKTSDEDESMMMNEDRLSSKRLFVRNLPFSVTEEDLSEHFGQYGTLEECHVPVDDQHRGKGFGFVSFRDHDQASYALEACDGSDFQGRIIQVLPARAARASKGSTGAAEPTTYKEKQELEKQNRGDKDQTGWSASFVRGDAVVDNLATRLGLRKGDVLGVKDGLSAGDAAVRLALGETAIIEENRKYFASHGIDMEALVSLKRDINNTSDTIERSKTSILVKNLPADTTKEELSKVFGTAGVNPSKILLPPSRTIALLEYVHSNEAKTVCRKLAYRRFKDIPLYLEYAPLAAHTDINSNTEVEETKIETEEKDGDAAEDTLARAARPTLYIRNLNFSTTEEELADFFSSTGHNVKSVRIPVKVAPAKLVAGKVLREEKMLSMGYGFVEFGNKDAATIAMEELQRKMLAGHALHLEITKQSAQASVAVSKKKSSKIMVRNVPFQANRKELLTLFGSFGQLKRVRLPKKFDGNHRGFAFVDYVSSKEASEAMKALSRTHLYGRRLVIEWAEEDNDMTDAAGTDTVQPKNKKIRFT